MRWVQLAFFHGSTSTYETSYSDSVVAELALALRKTFAGMINVVEGVGEVGHTVHLTYDVLPNAPARVMRDLHGSDGSIAKNAQGAMLASAMPSFTECINAEEVAF